jgi:transcriptional regulator GlxA family with amidase domain
MSEKMATPKVGFPLYKNFDSLDVLGPLQTFTWAGMDRHLVAPSLEAVTSFEGVSIVPDTTFQDCPPAGFAIRSRWIRSGRRCFIGGSHHEASLIYENKMVSAFF